MAGGEDGSAAVSLLAPPERRHEGCPGCRLEEANKTSTGVPYLNFFYIWIVCLTNTLPIQSLFPYLYFMIRDLKVAKQQQDIGFYAGFVGASYFLARTFSSVPWGIFADKYGRKPCVMISILSVIVFNTLFGLSTTYWMAIVTRGLLGMLCGILGPIKAYAIEVCKKEHQALGISIVTTTDAIVLVVGLAIGGFLSQPAEKYPNVFSKESIFARFPYFLPCFVILILAMGSCIACIWLLATINIACNILQNTAVTQEQRGVANGISMTLMSLFKGVAPAAAGILFSWAQKHMNGLFLPGDQIMFLMINMVSILGLILTFKPFFSMSNALRRS